MLINALDWCSDVREELQEERDVGGRLWQDNVDPSIVGPDSSVIFNVLIDPVDRDGRAAGRNNAHLEGPAPSAKTDDKNE